MKKVKGYCPQCLNWRAFQLQEVHTNVQQIFTMGGVTPVNVGGIQHYFGTCSKGHQGPLSVWKPLHPRTYRREVKQGTFLGRDCASMTAYLFWKASFRRPRIEDHYKKDHECAPGCPEYDYEPIWTVWDFNEEGHI